MEKKNKIMIVDDDSFLLDMYALKFSQNDFEVTTALGSDKAMEKLNEGYVPDIMLLDVVMPGMNGFELLQKMKEDKLAEKTIKIILSNRGQTNDIEEGKKNGAVGYIVKANSTPAEVIDQVKKYLK
jgi:DNA-binding response OmpR family regulator